MKIKFESDYQNRILNISFEERVSLNTSDDIMHLRQVWLSSLSSWHSPYKAMIDCQNLEISNDIEVEKALQRLEAFMKGFFLKKAVGWGFKSPDFEKVFPWDTYPTEDEAAKGLGIRTRKSKQPSDFRENIQIQNHFRQHVVEISFDQDANIDTVEKVEILKSKMTNNLMQWHSKWSLMVDCQHLNMDPKTHQSFNHLVQFLRSFFMKTIIGYSPKGDKSQYPFKVYRSRHRAAAILEGEGNFSGDDADCNSRKAKPKQGP
ncbi:MAG: hypothetical protein CMP10_15210 [Zetaproteobacteria bacterium]|nr:hypothetical protein [Pseudobdellovibrionaceae bacterium]